MSFSRCARWLATALLLAVTAADGNAQTPAPKRVFELDLHSLGAVDLEIPGPPDSHHVLRPPAPESLSFLDDSTLAVSFTILNPRTALSTRDNPQGGSRLFHTSVLDLRSGRVISETSWGTAHPWDRLFALRMNLFLVRSGNKLGVFSSDWKKQAEYKFEEPPAGEPAVWLLLSPTLHTLFLIRASGEHHEQVDVLASETLTRLSGFTVESVGRDAGSDSHFAYLLPAKKGYALFVLPLNALGGAGPPSIQPVYFTQDDGCTRPSYVTDDLLVLAGYCDVLRLVASDGTVKTQQHLGNGFLLAGPLASGDQQSFAIDVAVGAFPIKTEGKPDPVRVYRTSPLTTVSEVAVRQSSIERIPRWDFALSPDGSRLAVLDGFDLSVYQLPALAPEEAPVRPEPQATRPRSALSTHPAPAQPATPTTAPATGGGNAAEYNSPQVEVQHAAGLEITASLDDLRQDAIRAMVRISNHGTAEVAVAPERATIEILNPAAKMLRAMNPDKLATAIRRVAENDAEQMRYGCGPGDTGGDAVCPQARADAFEMERSAEATAADVKASALRAQVLKPGEQVEGAIFFTYQKKRGESVLRLPVGDQVFEFHFPPKKKKE